MTRPPHSRGSTGRDRNLVPLWRLWKAKSSRQRSKKPRYSRYSHLQKTRTNAALQHLRKVRRGTVRCPRQTNTKDWRRNVCAWHTPQAIRQTGLCLRRDGQHRPKACVCLFSRMSRVADPQPSCSRATRRGDNVSHTEPQEVQRVSEAPFAFRF